MWAELIDGLAQRYGQLPSTIRNEPGSTLQMLQLIQLGQPDEDEEW